MSGAAATARASPAGAAAGPPRAVQVIASVDPIYGGTSYVIERLGDALARRAPGTRLMTLAPAPSHCGALAIEAFAQDFAKVPVLSRLRFSRELAQALRAAAHEADVLHTHGLWLMPNVYPAEAAKGTRARVVVSPHGMLGPAALAFSRGRKRAFSLLAQGAALASAACVHATSALERDDIRAYGLKTPIAIIPNGVDIPDIPPPPAVAGPRTILTLGRVHPKKGLDRLVRAWGEIERERPDWRLRIVGRGEIGHDDELRRLANQLGLERVLIEDAVFGPEKFSIYSEAELFVLATLNENFGLTVAEALSVGTPAISTKGAPWEGLAREGCGWWIDHGVEPLAQVLREATALPPERLADMGRRGRDWMRRDFSWERVADQMLALYGWLRDGGAPPAGLEIDGLRA